MKSVCFTTALAGLTLGSETEYQNHGHYHGQAPYGGYPSHYGGHGHGHMHSVGMGNKYVTAEEVPFDKNGISALCVTEGESGEDEFSYYVGMN